MRIKDSHPLLEFHSDQDAQNPHPCPEQPLSLQTRYSQGSKLPLPRDILQRSTSLVLVHLQCPLEIEAV